VPSVRHLRDAAQRMHCQSNARQLGLALLNYRDVYKTFPCAITYADDGTPMHSWRCAVWPFFEWKMAYRYEFWWFRGSLGQV